MNTILCLFHSDRDHNLPIGPIVSSIISMCAALFGVSIICRMSVLPLFHQKWVNGCQNSVYNRPSYQCHGTVNPVWTNEDSNPRIYIQTHKNLFSYLGSHEIQTPTYRSNKFRLFMNYEIRILSCRFFNYI